MKQRTSLSLGLRRVKIAIVCAFVTGLIALHPIASAQPPRYSHTLPFVTPASNVGQPGFVRVINRTNRGGSVRIVAIDDTGRRFGPVNMWLPGRHTRHFSSRELEQGVNRQLTGLSAGVGNGTDNWRLELSTTLEIEPLAYIRRADGFVTSMHEVAAGTRAGSRWRYRVPFFNPASDLRNVSFLRLINPGSVNASIVISGVDDRGRAQSGGAVLLTMMPRTARMLTAQQLEQRDPGNDGGRSEAGTAPMLTEQQLEQGDSGFSSRFGAGSGRWQLLVSSNRQIQVMSLLRGPAGHLANLSRGQAVSSDGPPPPNRPDLVVRSPSVSNSNPNARQTFTLRATVRNQGNVRSAATTLRYYRSSDGTISTADAVVGTDAVGGLSASGTSNESIVLTAPSSAGTYYYGACVNSVSGESNTNNNCSSAVRVTVQGTAPSTRPDLVVWSPSVSNSNPNAGQTFTLRATVRNRGQGRSAATTLRYYRSTDGTISTADAVVGTDAVGGLSASGTSNESIVLTAPSSAGTYYYGACVNSVSGESNTNNNCSSAVRVTVQGTAPSTYVGAIAPGWRGEFCDSGYGWGFALNHTDRNAAISRATSECQSLGLLRCSWIVAFAACGALAYGESSTRCALYGGGGTTKSAAEQDALSDCRETSSNCRISGGTSGSRASYCNANAQTTPHAEVQSSSDTIDIPFSTSNSDSRPEPSSPRRGDGG